MNTYGIPFEKMPPLVDPSIYDGVDLPYDGQTWPSSSSPIFAELVQKHQPKVIIEVGSWKGVSARKWAELAGPDCRIYCVDTWLTAADPMLTRPEDKDYAEPHQNGHCMVYWTFLSNIKKWGFHQQVTPIINTSSIGAEVLAAHRITSPLIYIDGDHSYRQCYADLCAYWPLLESGGSMLVDDFKGYTGVYAACIRFIEENQLWKSHRDVDNAALCLLQKP